MVACYGGQGAFALRNLQRTVAPPLRYTGRTPHTCASLNLALSRKLISSFATFACTLPPQRWVNERVYITNKRPLNLLSDLSDVFHVDLLPSFGSDAQDPVPQ